MTGGEAGSAPPPRARRRLRLEPLLWLALAAFLAYRVWPQVAAAFGVASASTVAPDFHLTTLDGAPLSRDALRGKVVLVNFWATWCAPCRVEMPGFQDVYERHRDRGFTIVGVSIDRAGSAHVRRWLAERGITYPVAMASGAIVQDYGGVRGIPTSFLLDRQGRIRHQVYGPFAELTLDQAVQRLIDEPADAPPAPAVPAGRD